LVETSKRITEPGCCELIFTGKSTITHQKTPIPIACGDSDSTDKRFPHKELYFIKKVLLPKQQWLPMRLITGLGHLPTIL
jgi:hypothetical protein